MILLVLLLACGNVAAQDADPTVTSTYLDFVNVRSGPGETFSALDILRRDVAVRIIERNRVGTWVRVQRYAADGSVNLDGWVVSGYLNQKPVLRFSQIPMNPALADADPNNVSSQLLKQLYAYPVMPLISEAMKEVYARGQSEGLHRDVVTKVGDSLVANEYYLEPMSQPAPELGAYDYLADTVAFFGPSVAGGSAAARIGLTTYVISDPMWADKSICQPAETPLECEYRLKQPAVALIMFGPNDVAHVDTTTYSNGMRQVVEASLERGIIPVLFTFSYSPDAEFWWQAVNFNLALGDIAAEYQVPLVNLWAAARILPDYGLDDDQVHLKNSGFTNLKFDRGADAFYGVALQNLLAVRILDELRRTVIDPLQG